MVNTSDDDNINNNDNNNNKILLVDDEIDITTVYTLGLQDNGFKVDAFNDPLQALSDLKSGFYDLVLIDYKMPKMNGFEFYKQIRKTDDKVKVCIITAFDVDHGEIKKEFQGRLNATYQDEQIKKDLDVKCFIQKPMV
jgi:two-component system catabolic regulation response regulator CreB/two-component system response regulator ChvI